MALKRLQMQQNFCNNLLDHHLSFGPNLELPPEVPID